MQVVDLKNIRGDSTKENAGHVPVDTHKDTENILNFQSLYSGKLLARNTTWNLFGQGVPLLAAFVTIPFLLKGLGTARFGILTLAWAFMGYFNLFDLGIGRALTKLVAEKIGSDKEREIPHLIWTALFLMLLLGLLGTVVAVVFSDWIVSDMLNIPDYLQSETLQAFYLIALSIPLTILSAGLQGVLEAFQSFRLINTVRIPMGIMTFIGPLMVLFFTDRLPPVVGILVFGRLLFLAVYFYLCIRVVSAVKKKISIRFSLSLKLLSFGSWMTVSNLITPAFLYLDRFLIGSMLSISAVAYYTTPMEMISRLLIFPRSLVGVLFPAFSISYEKSRDRTVNLFVCASKYTFLALFPITLIIVNFSYEIMQLWIGREFADKSAYVLQWLAIGVFLNSLAHLPFALLQGAGRPDLTAKLHMVELPIYVICLWVLLSVFNILGAAIAWTIRMFLDTVALYFMALGTLHIEKAIRKKAIITTIIALFSLGAATLIIGLWIKFLYVSTALGVFGLLAWYNILNSDERSMIQDRLLIAHFARKKA